MDTILIHDDDDRAVAGEGVEGNGIGPVTSEVDFCITTLRGNLDRGGVLLCVGADGGLHVGDGDILALHIELSQGFEGFAKGLAVERVVAVGGAAVALGCESLLDGTQVVLEVHLDHLEDGLTELRCRGVIGTRRHGGCRTGVGDTVAGYVRDTVDGTGGFAARADLSYFCHNFFKLIMEN